jgi:hypothetical protein
MIVPNSNKYRRASHIPREPLFTPMTLRGLGILGSLGQSNVNATTIFIPGTGAGTGWLAQTGNVSSAITGSPVFQAPALSPAPACSQDPGSMFTQECINQVLANQEKNMAANNASSYNYDVGTCESNLAENNAQRNSLGMPLLPDTCASDTFNLVPTQTPTTGGINIQTPNAAALLTTPGIVPQTPTLAQQAASVSNTGTSQGQQLAQITSAGTNAGGSGPQDIVSQIESGLTSTTNIAGNDIPVWGILAAVAAGLVLLVKL